MEETYGLIVDPSGTRYKTNPYKKDTDDDGLYDNVEISKDGWCEKEGKDHYGNRIYKRYHHMNSDPTNPDSDGDNWSDGYEVKTSKTDPMKADTDDDGIIDNEDKYPLSMQPSFMSTLKKMEKIVDEAQKSESYFLTTLSEYDYKEYKDSIIKPNAIITMNIIRFIGYGSKGYLDEIRWNFTSGNSFNVIKNYINKIDPNIMSDFKKYNTTDSNTKKTFVDPNNQEVDFIHMLATLSAYYYPYSIVKNNKELSGWAGDLQSLIYDIKTNYYGMTVNLNDEVYDNLITKEKTFFPMPDMLADIDAENIYNIYSNNENMYLSEMIEDYYNKNEYYKKRYHIFVDQYDGIENLEKKTNELTSGNDFIKHYILNQKAKLAADTEKVKKKYEESIIGYVSIPYYNGYGISNYYQPIYSYTNPKTVTKEESDALTYAFIKFMKVKIQQ